MWTRRRTFATRLALAFVVLPACAEEELPARPRRADAGDGAAPIGAEAPPLPPNSDPKDLDPANGDASLDIAASGIFFDGDAPWVRVAFFGAWPPSAQIHSWSCAVILGTENAPVVNYTVTGTRSAADGIDEGKITYAVEREGFRVRFGDPQIAFDRYGVECSVRRTPDSTSLQDTSGNFVVTEKIQRTFGN